MTYLREHIEELSEVRQAAFLARAKAEVLELLRNKGPFCTRVTTSADTYDWEFPTPFNDRPVCVATADALAIVTVDAGPTKAGVRFRIRRPVGATGPVTLHMIAMEP